MKTREALLIACGLALLVVLAVPLWAEVPAEVPELDLEEPQPVECSEAVASLEAQLAEDEQAPMTLESFQERLEAQEANTFEACEPEEKGACPAGCICFKRCGQIDCFCDPF